MLAMGGAYDLDLLGVVDLNWRMGNTTFPAAWS